MIPYSRAAWETWEDIFWAVAAGLMEPPPLVWGCPNNPWVIINNHQPNDQSTGGQNG